MKNDQTNTDCSYGKSEAWSCNLTSPELKKRKETVIQSLKSQILEKKALPEGFAFLFKGNDALLDELILFIKTERECCPFFSFDLSISGNKSKIWLSLTGPEGVKDFITGELGF